jgi:hypothetical protein
MHESVSKSGLNKRCGQPVNSMWTAGGQPSDAQKLCNELSTQFWSHEQVFNPSIHTFSTEMDSKIYNNYNYLFEIQSAFQQKTAPPTTSTTQRD